MTHEVVVVGAGIGGLTVSALLAARGVDVCLLERQSRPGGCLAGFEKFGYTFDPGVGLYPLWQSGEIHEQVFSELPVAPPNIPADLLSWARPDQANFHNIKHESLKQCGGNFSESPTGGSFLSREWRL